MNVYAIFAPVAGEFGARPLGEIFDLLNHDKAAGQGTGFEPIVVRSRAGDGPSLDGV
jgi:hypothetical protein